MGDVLPFAVKEEGILKPQFFCPQRGAGLKKLTLDDLPDEERQAHIADKTDFLVEEFGYIYLSCRSVYSIT